MTSEFINNTIDKFAKQVEEQVPRRDILRLICYQENMTRNDVIDYLALNLMDHCILAIENFLLTSKK